MKNYPYLCFSQSLKPKPMRNFREEYYNLKVNVISTLRDIVNKSEVKSKYVDAPAIKVSLGNYTELTFVHDALHFIDDRGMHSGIGFECTLEDLIDILERNRYLLHI